MKQTNILNGIVFAIIASLSGALLLNLLPIFFTMTNSISLSITTLSLGYLIYLYRYSDIRQGKVILFVVWAMVNFSVWLFDFDLITLLGINLATIWLARSLYFHASVIAAFLDLLLIIMAGGAASWALLHTGSLLAAIWIFFLCQSLFCAIPNFSKPASEIQFGTNHANRFQSAHRVAEEAVRKLSLN